MIQPRDDAKELCLTDTRGPEKTDHLALRAVLAHDVANFRIYVSENDLVLVRKADVVNLQKCFAVGAAVGHRKSSQIHELLSFFKLQIRVREQEFLGQSARVVLKQSNQQNGDLNRKYGVQPEVFVLIQQQCTDTTLRPGDAFDHREHHPAHGRVLPHGIESSVCFAQDDHFPNDAPLTHAQCAGQVKFFFRNLRHHVDHAGHKEDRHAKNQEAYL